MYVVAKHGSEAARQNQPAERSIPPLPSLPSRDDAAR